MGIKEWIIILTIFVFFFGVVQASNGATPDLVRVDFDEQTLERGYTVKSIDNNLWIPLLPGQFAKKNFPLQ